MDSNVGIPTTAGFSGRARLAGIAGLLKHNLDAIAAKTRKTWIGRIAEWIGLERACCPFLRFALDVEPNIGAVWLRLTGTARVKEFIGATFHP